MLTLRVFFRLQAAVLKDFKEGKKLAAFGAALNPEGPKKIYNGAPVCEGRLNLV
jgi:hypothetical protein